MARTLGDWGLREDVTSLHRLAHARRGIQDDELLAGQDALLPHGSIGQRTRRGVAPREAIEQAIEDLRRYAGTRFLITPEEVEAVAVLLYAANSELAGSGFGDEPISPRDRAREACALLGRRRNQVDHFRKGRPRDGGLRSPETDLLGRFADALERIDAPASVSLGISATREHIVEFEDLTYQIIGTWAGHTESTWLLKDPELVGAGKIACYMVVAPRSNGVVVRWFYRHGYSTAVAARLVTADSPRILSIYEAYVTYSEALNAPSHRGGCILALRGEPVAGMAGPYWTDRHTHGTLSFGRRSAEVAKSFREAEKLFR